MNVSFCRLVTVFPAVPGRTAAWRIVVRVGAAGT